MSVETLRQDMAALQRLMAQADREVGGGQLIDLSALEQTVTGLCQRIAAVPGDHGRALRGDLISLIDDLDKLSRRIEEQMRGLRDRLDESSTRRRAVSAYGQSGKS